MGVGEIALTNFQGFGVSKMKTLEQNCWSKHDEKGCESGAWVGSGRF